jgi:hypothetical protein
VAKNESKESVVNTAPDFDALLGEKSVKVSTTRYLYKPETCRALPDGKACPLVGFLVGAESKESTNTEIGEYKMLIVRTTQPVQVESSTGVTVVEAGAEVMIVATYELTGLVRPANHSTTILKVAILPTTKEVIDQKSKKAMWHFEVRRAETLFSRQEIAPDTIVEQLVAPAIDESDSHVLTENV